MKVLRTYSIKKIAFSMLSLLLTSQIAIAKEIPFITNYALNKDIIVLDEYSEDYRLIKKNSTLLISGLSNKIKFNIPLTANETEQLNYNIEKNIKLQKQVTRLFEKYRPFLNTYIEDGTLKKKYKTIEETYYTKMSLFAVRASLLSADFHMNTLEMYQGNKYLRKLFNEKNSAFKRNKNTLRNYLYNSYSFEKRNELEKAINIRNNIAQNRAYILINDKVSKNLDSKIIISDYYNKKQNLKPLERMHDQLLYVKKNAKFYRQNVIDFFGRAVDKIQYSLIKAFGFTFGQIQWRKGYLYKNYDAEKKILSRIKPMDVLFDRIGAKLNGKFIPGHWGHNAIWIGTEEELKSLGIWNHDLIKPLQDDIRNGKSIIEALDSGVVLNTMEHFLNIDDIAVTRYKKITKKEVVDGILRAVSHIGKKYDYTFTTETQESLICSEVVYASFPQIKFKEEIVAGRWTITPESIASETFPGGLLETITLYHDGKEISGDLALMMSNLSSGDQFDGIGTRNNGSYKLDEIINDVAIYNNIKISKEYSENLKVSKKARSIEDQINRYKKDLTLFSYLLNTKKYSSGKNKKNVEKNIKIIERKMYKLQAKFFKDQVKYKAANSYIEFLDNFASYIEKIRVELYPKI